MFLDQQTITTMRSLLGLGLIGCAFSIIALCAFNSSVVDDLTATLYQACEDRLLPIVASCSAWCLCLIGESATVSGATILSERGGLSVITGCDALQPTMLLLAGILLFPAPWRHRCWGLIMAVGLMQAANVLRLVALYLVLCYWPSNFDFLHTEVGQALMLLVAVGLWLGWLACVESSYRANVNNMNPTKTRRSAAAI